MVFKSGSFVLIESFLLAFYVLELGAVQEKEILNTIREFLNNFPNQDNYFTDGIILNVQEMDNNLQKIEVKLHASKIDPTTTKLVKCVASIRSNSNNIEIIPELGYKCEDATVPKYEFYGIRSKRSHNKHQSHEIGGEVEKDPKKPKYKEMAETALKKFGQVKNNLLSSVKDLEVDVARVTEQVVSGFLVRITFGVEHRKRTGEAYACSSETWIKPVGVQSIMKVNCIPTFYMHAFSKNH